MTREVPLSRGLVAIVDDQDYDRVTAIGKWYADANCGNYYARKNYWSGGRCLSLKMHTFVTGWDYVDHVNGNGLDNRRANLRPASDRENSWNRPVRTDSTTGLKGVARGYGTRFKAAIQKDGQRRSLGGYATAEEAARAYDRAALDLFGPFARTNFPREDYVA